MWGETQHGSQDYNQITMALVNNEVGGLPDKQYYVITLKYLHRQSNRDIALMIGVSESTINDRLRLAYDNLNKV